MATSTRIVLYVGNDNCAAWYLDGDLQAQGETHIVTEDMYAYLGVDHRESNEFLRGTHGTATEAAPTLLSIVTYVEQQDNKEGNLRRASKLRVEANEALALAAQLESLYR